MMRLLLVLVCMVMPAAAKPPSAKAAKAANEAAFTKALAKQKLKTIVLATVPADPDESTDDTHFVGNVVFDQAGHHDPTFVVDAAKNVFRVDRKFATLGRVIDRVCHAGPQKPIRVKRTRFDVPAGHTFKGDVDVAYDAWVIDEQNTCK